MTRRRPDDAEPLAPLGRTLSLARPAAGRLAGAILLGCGAVAASIGLMGTSAWLISRAAQHPQESSLALAIVAVQFFGLSRGLFRYGERLVGHDAAFRLLADLRIRIYRRLERLAPAGLPIFGRGDLLARTVHDVDSLQDLPLRVLPPFAIALVVGAATVGVVGWILPGAAAVLGIALVLGATLVPWLTGWLARRTESGQAGARGELTTAFVDLIEGAPELVVYGATGVQLERIEGADRALTRVSAASARTSGLGLALTTALSGGAMLGGLALGVPAVHQGRMNGVFLAVIALIPLAAFELVGNLPVATQALERVRRAAYRVFEVTDAPDPVHEPAAPAPLPDPPHHLELRGVGATYPGRTTPALAGLDLTLPPGRRVAVVGPSGAGKSTLAAVLVRFLEPCAGTITLDGTAYESLAGDDLRTVVGLVAQDSHLFDTTLAENLRLVRRSASDQELVAALERVGLGPWFTALPEGLSTEVGERGNRLSGGERRRVAVARALLADFPVLVLDEPAEHLDRAAADALSAELLDLTVGRTTVLITHRLLGLEAVDEVLVLEGGRVTERGTHAELVAGDGFYAGQWARELLAENALIRPVARV